MLLKQLLKNLDYTLVQGCLNTEVTDIYYDSRKVTPGGLFVCIVGTQRDSHDYAADVAAKGAAVLAIQHDLPAEVLAALPDVTVVKFESTRYAMALLSTAYFGRPALEMTMVGVTGTKGKTTTTYMTHAVMDAVTGTKTGLLSGMEHDMGGQVTYTHLTTPESLEMQQLFAEARKHKLPVVTAEISSQAYQVHRTYGQHFRYGIFLDIGPDHISPHEHPTMEDYLRCKEALLENSDVAIIVRSTDYFDHVLAAAKKADRTIVVGMAEDGECDYAASNIQKLPRGYAFTVTEKATGRHDTYKIAMDGLFNIENALAAIAVGRDMGGDPSVISAALEHLVVPGRADVMEGAGLKVFINYMHNGISCQAVLKALKKDYPGKFVTVVIGVAGQRSPARIQGVGEACGKYADRVFFSADDPDLEDPRDIDIRLAHAAADGKAEIIIEPDRTIAVERALREAPVGSVVVLGGKGSEDTQRVNGEYVYYESDPAIAKRILAELEKQR
ncbi:MAG TPA: hypothetical protein DDY63_01995 [Ruminococcaceae bacterium]|nr:hypothetical protein [Oscillospiraceae bacterium]